MPPAAVTSPENVGLSTTSTFMVLPVTVTLVLVPSTTLTVAPGATFVAGPPLACRFQPFSAVAFTSVSCDTLTASVGATPAVTPVMRPEPPSLMTTLPNFGASAIWRLITPAGSTYVRRFAPEYVPSVEPSPLMTSVSPRLR
ncbi:hypothetical protein D3C81_1171920 [compost metagenome]